MKMSAHDIQMYPKFTKYVSVEIPQLASSPLIVNAIVDAAGIDSKKKIQKALVWGHGPMIEIRGFPDKETPDGVIHVAGGYTDGTDALAINVSHVYQFELGQKLQRTKHGHLVATVGVILLHELVHWASDTFHGGASVEQQHTFESKVYGGSVVSE